ncbi:MAG TPA: SMP-30/gluconolactonase/LRE family protein [Candidatus Acidoferrum sp.]|nr:SMP-30/gluconolactonase/LRE family protein [Candidatus Acidoferrum sp.]
MQNQLLVPTHKNPLTMRVLRGVSLAFLTLFVVSPWAAKPLPQQRKFELKADSPDFWKLIPPDATLTTLASGFGFTEGPVWDPSGFLYVSDEDLNKIFRVYPDGHREELLSLGDPDGNTYDARNQLLDCASQLRAIIRISRTGKIHVLADKFRGKRFNSPNDVVLGPDGAIYFTDPTLDLPKGQKKELPYQGVYRLDSRGRVTLLTSELSQPNGLAFSPDGARLYVDDSEKRNIRVYDFHPGGTLANGRIFAEEPGAKGDGVPDGIKVDLAGNLFVTGPGGIWVWDPTGRHLGTILTPEQPANLAWGDADFSTLYITATTSVYRLKTATRGFVPYSVNKMNSSRK